jgi:hypothetical protein
LCLATLYRKMRSENTDLSQIPNLYGGQMATNLKLQPSLESRGTCDICKRFMTNQQELVDLNGRTIHRACTPIQQLKKPNTFHA